MSLWFSIHRLATIPAFLQKRVWLPERGLRAFLPFLKLVICLFELESLVPYVHKDLSTLVKSPMPLYSLRVMCNAWPFRNSMFQYFSLLPFCQTLFMICKPNCFLKCNSWNIIMVFEKNQEMNLKEWISLLFLPLSFIFICLLLFPSFLPSFPSFLLLFPVSVSLILKHQT